MMESSSAFGRIHFAGRSCLGCDRMERGNCLVETGSSLCCHPVDLEVARCSSLLSAHDFGLKEQCDATGFYSFHLVDWKP